MDTLTDKLDFVVAPLEFLRMNMTNRLSSTQVRKMKKNQILFFNIASSALSRGCWVNKLANIHKEWAEGNFFSGWG